MKEIWKPINGYNGRYEVSNLGRVRSFARKDCILLTADCHKNGYLFVKLTMNGKSKSQSIHRLVASAFIPNPNGFPQVNHKDENRQNNSVINLEWCTAKYNLAYGNARKKVVEKRAKPCAGIWKDGTIKIFDSCSEAERQTGINHGYISRVCNGKIKKPKQTQWFWYENEKGDSKCQSFIPRR